MTGTSPASLDDLDTTALGRHLAAAFDAREVTVDGVRRLTGGAIQENWAVDAAVEGGPRHGRMQLVLRTDSPSQVATSLSRGNEFELLEAAWRAGVTVPEPIHFCDDLSVIGKPFAVMQRMPGFALGQKVAKQLGGSDDGELLAARLGAELAAIHAITPDTHRFDFLAPPPKSPALAEVATLRGHLDALGRPRPVLEWTLRWLERRAPCTDEVVLAHHDYRTGNYLVDGGKLSAILDWEFAGWSDRHEDLGWFCATCWRFSRRDLEAGGIGSRNAFYRGYAEGGGRTVDPARVYWWEVFAHARWAVIALQQGERCLGGGEPSLHLALTGLIAVELEAEMLRMTAPDRELPEESR